MGLRGWRKVRSLGLSLIPETMVGISGAVVGRWERFVWPEGPFTSVPQSSLQSDLITTCVCFTHMK